MRLKLQYPRFAVAERHTCSCRLLCIRGFHCKQLRLVLSLISRHMKASRHICMKRTNYTILIGKSRQYAQNDIHKDSLPCKHSHTLWWSWSWSSHTIYIAFTLYASFCKQKLTNTSLICASEVILLVIIIISLLIFNCYALFNY